MEKYKLYITSESGERETWTNGETVKECIDKLKDFHTFGEFEKEFFTKKGGDRLNKELNSGWYIDFKTSAKAQVLEVLNNGIKDIEDFKHNYPVLATQDVIDALRRLKDRVKELNNKNK